MRLTTMQQPDSATLADLGCDAATYRALAEMPGKPILKYRQQRSKAEARGIQWQLTLTSWWGIWANSGKWPLRGSRRGQFVMARWQDVGPYHVGNVRIAPVEENIIESLECSHFGHAVRGHSFNPADATRAELSPELGDPLNGLIEAEESLDGQMAW